MFKNCTALVKAPDLPAEDITNANYCYYEMFYGCTGLVDAPYIAAKNTAEYCFCQMFMECFNLVNVQDELYPMQLTHECYHNMFYNCRSLISTPNLPATEIATECYQGMFRGCNNLVYTQSVLPATNLFANCYEGMYCQCYMLKSAPQLPATKCSDYCYQDMFYECRTLTEAPQLPATNLGYCSYRHMFYKCIGLTKSPVLPNIQLSEYCLRDMFRFCSNLNEITVNFTSWHSTATYWWVEGVSKTGVFKCPDNLPREYGVSRIPSGWTINSFNVNDNDDNDGSSTENTIAQLTITGTPYGADGTYTIYDTSATGFNRIWVLLDGSHCIRYTSPSKQWCLWVKIGSSVEDESDWIIVNSISDGENPWDNQLHDMIVCSKN